MDKDLKKFISFCRKSANGRAQHAMFCVDVEEYKSGTARLYKFVIDLLTAKSVPNA